MSNVDSNVDINLDSNLETRSNRPQFEKQKSKDLHVNFLNLPEISNEKKKYLTAKYGSKEINEIKRRLEIESWLSDRLKDLCKNDDKQVEIDLDNVIEMKSDDLKKQFLLEKFKETKDDKPEIDKFISTLLDKLNSTL